MIDFTMLIDGLTFSEACRALGIDGERKPRPKLTASRKRAGQLAAAWVREQRAKLNFLIIEQMEQRDITDESCAFELAEIFDRELIMLRGFYDALGNARGAAELLVVRKSIEQITDNVEIIDEPPPPFLPLTAHYLDKLKKIRWTSRGVYDDARAAPRRAKHRRACRRFGRRGTVATSRERRQENQPS